MKAFEKYILLFVFFKKMFCTGDENMEIFVHAAISKLTDTLIQWNSEFSAETDSLGKELIEYASHCLNPEELKYDSERVKLLSDKFLILEQEYEKHRVNSSEILKHCKLYLEKKTFDKEYINKYFDILEKTKATADRLAKLRDLLIVYKDSYESYDGRWGFY